MCNRCWVALVAAWERVVMLAVAPTNPARTLILLLVFSLTLTGATMASAVLPFNYFTALRPCADETKPKSKSVAWRFSNWNWPTGFHKLVFFVLHVIVWFFHMLSMHSCSKPRAFWLSLLLMVVRCATLIGTSTTFGTFATTEFNAPTRKQQLQKLWQCLSFLF